MLKHQYILSLSFAGRARLRLVFLLTIIAETITMLPISFAGRARSCFAERSARVFPVLRCRGRARTLVVTAGAPSRCAESSFASPEKRAFAAFFTHAISAPLAPLTRARGKPKKPYSRRGEAQAPGQELFLRVACAASRSPEVFRVCPERSVAERRDAEAAGQWTLPKACRLALAANCDSAQRSAAGVHVREVRARPGRRSTLKTAGGLPKAAVDPRRELVV